MRLFGVSPLQTDLIGHYPDLAGLRRSAKSNAWSQVAAHFEQLPVRSDQSVAVRVVAETPGSERFLEQVVNSERNSSLARTLLGARFIVMAWEARGRTFAKDVDPSQWQFFFGYLERAERLLAEATAMDPTNAAAWTERVILARGLELGLDEGRHRYEQAAEHCDAPYTAQRQLLQNLCPKWGGSVDELHAFARDCLKCAPPGSLAGAVVANAHVEHALDIMMAEGALAAEEYIGQREVRDEIAAAAAHTVLHPEHRPWHGWVSAHSVFAFALVTGGDPRAVPHFEALGSRVCPYPWEQVYRRWKAAFRRLGNHRRPL